MHIAFTPTPEMLIAPQVYKTPIEGLYFLPHQPHPDNRGFYAELTKIPELEAAGISFAIKQMNLSHSNDHVIRGFHAENWNKLLTVVHGTCFCAWLDIRPDSPTFGDVVSMTVGPEAPAHFGSVFVSAGIANSFCVTKGPAEYLYVVDQLYSERDTSFDTAIALFDPDLAVPWPLQRSELIISDRDASATTMREKFPEHFV